MIEVGTSIGNNFTCEKGLARSAKVYEVEVQVVDTGSDLLLRLNIPEPTDILRTKNCSNAFSFSKQS